MTETSAAAAGHYDAWQRAIFLRHQMLTSDGVLPSLLEDSSRAEKDYLKTSRELAKSTSQASGRATGAKLLGAASTGIEATVQVKVSHVPTAICHLLNPTDQPLVRCIVRNASDNIRRMRVVTWVEGFSAPSTETVELKRQAQETLDLLPTFYPDRLRSVTELTRATLVVRIDDLDGAVEIHRSFAIWLLARTTAALSVEDPSSGDTLDLSPYLAAFVTPNAGEVQRFLSVVADRHESGAVYGYQGNKDVVAPQVEAVFDALKLDSGIKYINSVVAFSPQEGANQRVRLPRESLNNRQANCLDGAVLVASLLEAMSLRPALVLTPGHAFIGWETWPHSDEWRYLDTTLIGGPHTFQDAESRADAYATQFRELAVSANEPLLFRQWSLANLRGERGIWPME